eukprot:CFRG6311T1
MSFYRDVEMWNNLYQNPWVDDKVYYFDRSGNLLQVNVKVDEEHPTSCVISTEERVPGAIERSALVFVSATMAVFSLADSSVRICFLTADGKGSLTKSYPLASSLAPRSSLRVMDALFGTKSDPSALFIAVQEMTTTTSTPTSSESNTRPTTTTVVSLKIVVMDVDTTARTCVFRSESNVISGPKRPEFVCISPEGKGLDIISEKLMVCEQKEIDMTVAMSTDDDVEPIVPATPYAWTQTPDSVSISFKINLDVQTTEIDVEFTNNSVSVSVVGVPLNGFGKLYAPVQLDGCVWTRESDVVDVYLEKVAGTGDRWVYVFEDDQTPETMDPSEVRGMLDALQKYTKISQGGGIMGGGQSRVAGLDQMEEIDFDDGPVYSMYQYTVTLTNSNTVVLSSIPRNTIALGGSQWQFSLPIIGDSYRPGFALKTNVDIAIYTQESDPSSTPFTHTNTFDALGYVLASKRNLKYKTIAKDSSYAVACDCNSQVYIYYQPATRHDCHADQSILTLPTSDRIVGLQALSNVVVVLTDSAVFMQWTKSPTNP